jgi:mannose-6-phosphate isomerase-like protein (cupin superfamily)
MFNKMLSVCFILLFAASAVSTSQSLEGGPYVPGKDANIDMFMGSWKDSAPKTTHGTLSERDILTKGDSVNPTTKGAVLTYVNRYVYAVLEANTATAPTTLKGEQEIYYFLSGKGSIKAGRKTAVVKAGVAMLIPEKLKFTLTNTGSEPLTMYLISEPTYDGFKPNKNMVVKDENTTPIGGTTGHWSHIVKRLIEKPDGLATIKSVLTVAQDPMTIGRPHSHDPGCEEVWTGVKGTSIAFLGKQIRLQAPGTAYNIPPDSKTPHCNINRTDEQVKLFYFSVRKDLE